MLRKAFDLLEYTSNREILDRVVCIQTSKIDGSYYKV